MRRIKRLILSALCIIAVISGTAMGAAAAAENLPAGILVGDQDGIHTNTQGEYFIDAEGLEPGDVIAKQLIIRNTESYTYKISMTAEPLEETGPLKLLDEVRCTLKLDGKLLYDGRVRGDDGINMILNALDLGSYQSGDQRTLDITLTVSPEMKTFHWTSSEAYFKWHFYAARTTPDENVKTGETVKTCLYFVLPGIVLAMGILLLIKRRQSGGKTIAN